MSREENNTLNISNTGDKIAPISLVNRALEELTNRASAGANRQRKSKIELLCSSLINQNETSSLLIRTMLESGISISDIYEKYIPDAARLLGKYWVQNKLSFVNVTLATSRLQAVAREFELLYIGSVSSGACGPEILIISPQGEQHTFGAQMISRKFRRLGASAYLSINNSKSEIRKIITKHQFKLIGLSISDYKLCNPKNELKSTIDMIKKFKIPIVAGGSLVHSYEGVLETLNLDLVTDDAMEALTYFNINLSDKNKFLDPITI